MVINSLDGEFLSKQEIVKHTTEVIVVKIGDLVDHIFPPGATNLNSPEADAKIKEWCDKMNAHYYAKKWNEFKIHEGIDEAMENGQSIVVVEPKWD